MSLCYKCNLPIKWGKSKSGKVMPTNVDGSSHWDACSSARTKKNIAAGKVYHPIASPWVIGKEYVKTDCDCLPWDGCEKCKN